MAPASLKPSIIRWRLLYHDATQRLEPQPLTMAMDKERPPLPNLHIRTPTHVFPSGRITLALMMLTTGLFLVLSTLHPATFYQYPMPTDISPQETKIGKPLLTSINLSALSSSCRSVPFFFFPLFFFLKLTGSFFVSNMIQLCMRSQLNIVHRVKIYQTLDNMFTVPVISKAYKAWLCLHIRMASFAYIICYNVQRHLDQCSACQIS